MIVPDVVQITSTSIEGSAVRGSFVQLMFVSMPNTPSDRVDQAVGLRQEREEDDDRRRAGDRGEVEGGPEERLAADLLVDDHRERQAERDLRRNDDRGEVERVRDRLADEDVIAEEVDVVLDARRSRAARAGPSPRG